MERSHTGYHLDPYVQYPRLTSQAYATPGTGNALPRTGPAGNTIDYIRTGQGAGEEPRRVEYYHVQEHPAEARSRPPVGEYYTRGPPAPGAVRPVPAATYYTQEPPTIPGGSKSCGCGGAPKVEYLYTQAAPVARDQTPVRLSTVTRQVHPPPATNQPPTGYYYVQESTPTRVAAIPAHGDNYPPPQPYPDSSGQQIISYERYVVPASSAFTYDPTAASHDYYRPALPPGAPQPSAYRYDGDGYPGHVTGGLQHLPHEVAERLGAMRIGGGGGGGGGLERGGRGSSDVIYVPRPRK